MRPSSRAAALSSVLALLALAAPARAGDAEGGVKKVTRGRLWKVAIVVSTDRRLRITVPSASTGSYGANAALNTQARMAAAEAIAPLLLPWTRTDVEGPLREALPAKLAAIKWLKNGPVSFAPGEQLRDVIQHVTDPEAGLLWIQVQHELAPSAAALTTSATVQLYSASSVRPGATTTSPFFTRAYHVHRALPAELPRGRPRETAARWGENGGERLRAAVAASLEELASLLAFDLALDGDAYQPSKRRVKLRDDEAGVAWTGVIDREEGGRDWVRVREGALHAVDGLGLPGDPAAERIVKPAVGALAVDRPARLRRLAVFLDARWTDPPKVKAFRTTLAADLLKRGCTATFLEPGVEFLDRAEAVPPDHGQDGALLVRPFRPVIDDGEVDDGAYELQVWAGAPQRMVARALFRDILLTNRVVTAELTEFLEDVELIGK